MISPKQFSDICVALIGLLAVACIVVLAGLFNSLHADEPRQLLPAETRARIVASIPRLANETLEKAVRDPRTVWYTRQAIGVVYQRGQGIDTDGRITGFALANINTSRRPEHSDDAPDHTAPDGVGGNPNVEGSFPWSQHAGGGHACPGLTDVKGVLFPLQANGQPWPVLGVHRVVPGFRPVTTRNHQRTTDQIADDWIFPSGTTFIEVIRDSHGTVFEVRGRTLQGDTWDVDALVPYPHASDLARAIRQHAPWYAGSPRLTRLVNHLESTEPLIKEVISDTNETKHAFRVAAYVDPLPPIGYDDLVKELMAQPFYSRIGTVWRKDAKGHECFAPTVRTKDKAVANAAHIVPVNWRGSHITGNDSCKMCHESTLVSSRVFDEDRGWYGDVRGNDARRYTNGGILSWHWVDASKLPADGQRARQPQVLPVWRDVFKFVGTESQARAAYPSNRYQFFTEN